MCNPPDSVIVAALHLATEEVGKAQVSLEIITPSLLVYHLPSLPVVCAVEKPVDYRPMLEGGGLWSANPIQRSG